MRKRSLLLALLALFIGTTAVADARPRGYQGSTDWRIRTALRHHKTVWITRGDGGDINQHFANIRRATRVNRHIVIDGPCYSACPLYLTLPAANVCFTDRATFHFHSAAYVTTDERGRFVSQFRSPAGNAMVRAVFPEGLQRWLDLSGALAGHTFVTAPLPTIQELFADRRCPAGPTPSQWAQGPKAFPAPGTTVTTSLFEQWP